MSSSLRKAIDSMPLSVKPVFAVLSAITISGFFFLIGLKIVLDYYHIDLNGFSSILRNASTPNSASVLRYFMALQTIALFAIAPLVVVWCYGKNILSIFSLNQKPSLFYLFLSVCLIIIANPCINFLLDYNGEMADLMLGATNAIKNQDLATQKIVESLFKDSSISALLLNTVIIAVLPAVFEELFFRGFIQKIVLSKYVSSHIAVLFTAFLFSFIHFQFYGFLPRFVLGIIFGYIFLWSGSLWVAISIHFVNNFMAVFANFLLSRQIISESADTIGTGSTQWLGLVSAITVGSILWLMFRKYQSSHQIKPLQNNTFAEYKS